MAQLGESDPIVLERDSSDVLVCLPKKKVVASCPLASTPPFINTFVAQPSPCQSAE